MKRPALPELFAVLFALRGLGGGAGDVSPLEPVRRTAVTKQPADTQNIYSFEISICTRGGQECHPTPRRWKR